VREPAQAVARRRHRYEKRAANYRAMVVIVALMFWFAA
jgi:hypothetical protein